jgi:hypothetical protein
VISSLPFSYDAKRRALEHPLIKASKLSIIELILLVSTFYYSLYDSTYSVILGLFLRGISSSQRS